MVEYIDKKKIIDKLSEELDILVEEGHMPEGYLTALSLIETIQAEDVVPVVRCKDCVKHYTVHCTLYIGETRDEYGNSTCHYCGATARDDFFCPDGEAEADNDK